MAQHSVHSVGCRADGQLGPQAAPPHPRRVQIDAPKRIALRLTFFQGPYDSGVLAPRGWRCVELYGSNGSTLLVTPLPIDAKQLLREDWRGLTGPAVQLSISNGGTSGRFEVARIIQRVFPKRKAFADAVIAEGLRPASDFPAGPYPHDTLRRAGDDTVFYVTPAHTEGLGTDTRLAASSLPIAGLLMIRGDDVNLIAVTVKMPAGDDGLVDTILEDARANPTRPLPDADPASP